MTVTVYGLPGCQACRATTRRLRDRGIFYTETRFDECEWIQVFASESGFTTAPVVRIITEVDGIHRDDYWDGYRPDRIDALVMS